MMRLLKFVLAAIGFLTVLKYGVITLLGVTFDPDEEVTIQVYPSPTGQYSAAHVSRSGGGVAPFCSDAVVVFNRLLDVNDVVKNDNYQVYSSECGSFFDHALSPNVQWESDDDVRIDVAIGEARVFSRKVDLRGTDASGNVQVRFAAYR
ncbi:hypothetical protein ACYZT3_09870 [Pseudomonas sp. MDT1-16]